MQARLSITRACRIAGLSRAAYYKRPASASERDADVIEALNAIVSRHGRWGFWKCFTRLRLDGRCWNKKRVHRVYCDMDLNLPRRCKKRLPAKPNQNAFIERFNRTYRTEVLDAHLFANLEQVQAVTDQWLVDYNEYRPHEALGGVPPVQYMPRLTHAPNLYRPLST